MYRELAYPTNKGSRSPAEVDVRRERFSAGDIKAANPSVIRRIVITNDHLLTRANLILEDRANWHGDQLCGQRLVLIINKPYRFKSAFTR